MKLLKHCIAMACTLALTFPASAQDAAVDANKQPDTLDILSGRPDTASEELLGGTFQNPLAGIAFRVPAACKPAPKSGLDEIARFASDDKSWEMVVTKSS